MMFRTVATTVANNTSGNIAGSESAIVDIVTQLGATFTKLIELMLSKEIKVCIIKVPFRFFIYFLGNSNRKIYLSIVYN